MIDCHESTEPKKAFFDKNKQHGIDTDGKHFTST